MNEDLELMTRVINLTLSTSLLHVSTKEKIAALEAILGSLRKLRKLEEQLELEILYGDCQ